MCKHDIPAIGIEKCGTAVEVSGAAENQPYGIFSCPVPYIQFRIINSYRTCAGKDRLL